MIRYQRQQLVADWVERTFGHATATHPVERALRVLEEALELAQAVDVPFSLVEKLTLTVFARDPGEPFQEVGGIAITLLAFCSALSIDSEQAEFAELRRILAKDGEHFRRRQREKISVGVVEPDGLA